MPVRMTELSLLGSLSSLRGASFKAVPVDLYERNNSINVEWILKFHARHFTHLPTSSAFSETSKTLSKILQQ